MEQINDTFSRLTELTGQIGIWLVVAFIYAIIGMVMGCHMRDKHNRDGLIAPLFGMTIALLFFLPLTIYIFG